MTPREQIEAMPDTAGPKVAFRALVQAMREESGRTVSAEAEEHIAANIYFAAKISRALANADVVTVLAELTALSALHLTAVEMAERARPADPKPLTDDEALDTFAAVRALDRLPDFGIDLTGKGN